MLQTYEAVFEPNGHLQFLENLPETLSESRRVLVTFTEPAAEPVSVHQDWQQLAGSQKDSPNLNGDPLAIQEAMRREWD